MAALLARLLQFPNMTLLAMGGVSGGVVGILIFIGLRHFRASSTRLRTGSLLVVPICVAIAVFAVSASLPTAEDEADVAQAMTQVKSNRLFQAIFRLHPAAESELRARLRLVARSTKSTRERFFASQRAGGELVGKYYNMHLGDGSSEMTFKLLRHQFQMMQAWAAKPDLCVDYFLGTPHYEASELSPQFIESETDTKADFLESAAANPMPLTTAPDPTRLRVQLVNAYAAKGYATEDLDKLLNVSQLPAMEGCEIATEFVDVIVSMGQEDGALLFKRLNYVSTHR